MGILNHLFGSTESIAKEIKADDESILKYWQQYLATISRKKAIIEKLRSNNLLQSDLQELRTLLDLELVDISTEEKKEKELISDLEAIEHSQKIKRVHKLEQCLAYAETKYEYVSELLQQLHLILKSQLHLLKRLQTKPKDTEKLISHLKNQLELELTILAKIENIKTFHNLFLALAKGEHTIQTMDQSEKRLLKKMQKEMSKIFSQEITQGMIYDWAMAVFNAVENKVHEGVTNGMFDAYHPDIDFEFVNRPEFIDLARETIQNLQKKKISEQQITVFVHIFREWYNHQRE